MTKAQTVEREAALADLHKMVKPGDTIYTKLEHVTRSGMYRVLDLYVIRDNIPLRITWSAALAAGFKYDRKHEGLGVNGCGMDTGFQAVHSLSHALYRDGFGCIGEGCPSNDHSNGDRDYTPHMDEKDRIGADGKLCTCHKTHWHADGGYALRHRWL